MEALSSLPSLSFAASIDSPNFMNIKCSFLRLRPQLPLIIPPPPTNSSSTIPAASCTSRKQSLRFFHGRRVPAAVAHEEQSLATLETISVRPDVETSSTISVEEEVAQPSSSPNPNLNPNPNPLRTCKLYVCNLPDDCDIGRLLEVFNTHGSVLSVEVCRNPETGKSCGSGYVTMGSIAEAKTAVVRLDRSDLGGRELCVRYAADVMRRSNDSRSINTPPGKNTIFESPHKIYVGNLSWSMKPEILREHFGQYGTIISTRVLYDRKSGRNRVYAFLSFSSSAELEAAKASDGVELHGREMLVREAVKRNLDD